MAVQKFRTELSRIQTLVASPRVRAAVRGLGISPWQFTENLLMAAVESMEGSRRSRDSFLRDRRKARGVEK